MKKQLLLKLNIVPKLGIKPAVSSRNNDLETGNLSAIIKKYRNRSSNIQKLNTKKATQLNGVPTKYIKKFSDVFAPVVTDDYNNCVDIVSFSECFKTAEVIPTYKKGEGCLPIYHTEYLIYFNSRFFSLKWKFSTIFLIYIF